MTGIRGNNGGQLPLDSHKIPIDAHKVPIDTHKIPTKFHCLSIQYVYWRREEGVGGIFARRLRPVRKKERSWLQVQESDLESIEPLYHKQEPMTRQYGRVLLQFRLKMETVARLYRRVSTTKLSRPQPGTIGNR